MESNLSTPKHSLLKSAVHVGALSPVDVEFTNMLFQGCSEIDENVAGVICHLTKSAREGHLCVKFNEGKLTPSPKEIWLRDCSEEPSEELVHFVQELEHAFEVIPEEFISDVELDTVGYPDQPICRFGQSLYLQKYWVFETHFIKHLQLLLKGTPEYIIGESLVMDKLSHSSLNQKQTEAVFLAFRNQLSIICGGPGTGKTHTAGTFVSIFTELFSHSILRIALTAPTGKAASKLRASLGDIHHAKVEAHTLHALLNLSPESSYCYPPKRFLPYDLIIVDECSMIDVKLMASLLPAIKQGARIILLGDPNQLPSVEAGSLFSDIINSLDSSSIAILNECLRVELEELVEFGKEINQGEITSYPDCVHCLHSSSESPWKIEEELIKEIVSHFPQTFTASEADRAFQNFRVLSPLRNGMMGVDQLNDKLLHLVYQKVKDYSEYAVPIMITRNHQKRELFNGETGLLVRKKGKSPYDIEEGDYALFGDRKIPALLLPKFEYAFCLSVHKSQGSEFEHVFLVLPKGSEWFGREMLYTAVTRAKKKLTIWGDQSVIEPTLKNHCQRSSGVAERLI